MLRTSILLTIGALGVLLLGGCGGGGGDTQSDTAAFLPLAAENTWRYATTDYTQAAARPAGLVRRSRGLLMRPAEVGTRQVEGEQIVRVSGTQEIGGSTWYAVVAQFVGGDITEPIYVRHNAQGLIQKADLVDAGHYLLRVPLEVGNTWVHPFNDQWRWTITGVGQTVSVAAGVFEDCVIVEDVIRESGQPDDAVTSWYARGVGLVREEHHRGDTLEDQQELIDYTLMP